MVHCGTPPPKTNHPHAKKLFKKIIFLNFNWLGLAGGVRAACAMDGMCHIGMVSQKFTTAYNWLFIL